MGIMISNQILQNTIDGLKNITRVDFCIMDVDGKKVASTADIGGSRRGFLYDRKIGGVPDPESGDRL